MTHPPSPRTAASALDECVRGSRLIGGHPELVLHGGGNSSIKSTITDITGAEVEVIYVKGSGWDMATIEPAGFAPLRLDRLRELLEVESISDSEMVNELRCALVDSTAPDASIEALLHSMLPHRAVLHSHADAIVTLTNQPDGARLVEDALGSLVVVVPYVMPGFDLARRCAELWPKLSGPDTIGMVLLNHGLFTFGDTMDEAYERHLRLIRAVELVLPRHETPAAAVGPELAALDHALLRRDVSLAAGRPMIVSRTSSDSIAAFVARPDLTEIAQRGPATPDHVIRTKRLPLLGSDVAAYADSYRKYFERNAARYPAPVQMLDPAPRYALDPAYGLLTMGTSATAADIVRDIAEHTIDVVTTGESLGSYQPLGEADMFDVEYWELEQAKLRRAGSARPLDGQVALVTGAASGIGAKCAEKLLALGAAVIGLDIAADTPTTFTDAAWLGVTADITDTAAVTAALEEGVARFGGLDILIVAAGVFAESVPITDVDPSVWRRTMAVNLDAAMSLFATVHPLLKASPTDARVVLVGSKNVAAPGPGAAAYSASKAAVTQLARVAALEWAPDGIRVNTVHPDAVFDTALWTPELLEERAAKYGVSVDAYKRRNLLSASVTSEIVASMAAAMCTEPFSATTGAQVPVDGGNERVI